MRRGRSAPHAAVIANVVIRVMGRQEYDPTPQPPEETMTESSTPARDRRRRVWITSAVAVVLAVAVVVGVRFTPSLFRWSAAESIVSRAEADIREVPGIASASAELDQRIRARSISRHNLSGSDTRRPDGEVTVTVTLAEGLTARELAHALGAVRSAFAVEGLDRHAVSIAYGQHGTDRRIFDGWGTVWKPKDLTDDALERIAAYALQLPADAWFDLDPTTFEQGQFDRTGPPLYTDLLGLDAAAAYTVSGTLDAGSTTAFLDQVAALTTASDELGGPTVLHLRGPEEAEVVTATAPPELSDALSEITTALGSLPDADAVALSYRATLEWTLDIDGTEGLPVVDLTIRTLAPSARCSTYTELVDAAERAFDARDITHTVDLSDCVGADGR